MDSDEPVTPLSIGYGFTRCVVDEVLVYNRELSRKEIDVLYRLK